MSDTTNTSNAPIEQNNVAPNVGYAGDQNFSGNDGEYDLRKMMDISAEETAENESKATPSKAPTESHEATSEPSTDDAPDETAESVEGDGAELEEQPRETEHLTFKSGDKEFKVPKDAQVQIKINGKVENIPLQTALNRASGNINLDRELNRVKKVEKDLAVEKSKFNEDSQLLNTHAQALLDMQDPYEFAEYYAQLKGLDSKAVFEDMINKTVEYIEKWGKMTQTEQAQELKIRELSRKEKFRQSQDKLNQSRTEATQKQEAFRSAITKSGLTEDEVLEAATEMKSKIEAGEELGDGLDDVEIPGEKELLKYATLRATTNKITKALGTISKDLAKDGNLVTKLKKALVQAESLHGKLTDEELGRFVKQAVNIDNKKLSESLSKKAQKAKSESVSSRKQVEDGEDDLTLDEYFERERYRSIS